jgi:hypothetical protein
MNVDDTLYDEFTRANVYHSVTPIYTLSMIISLATRVMRMENGLDFAY